MEAAAVGRRCQKGWGWPSGRRQPFWHSMFCKMTLIIIVYLIIVYYIIVYFIIVCCNIVYCLGSTISLLAVAVNGRRLHVLLYDLVDMSKDSLVCIRICLCMYIRIYYYY